MGKGWVNRNNSVVFGGKFCSKHELYQLQGIMNYMQTNQPQVGDVSTNVLFQRVLPALRHNTWRKTKATLEWIQKQLFAIVRALSLICTRYNQTVKQSRYINACKGCSWDRESYIYASGCVFTLVVELGIMVFLRRNVQPATFIESRFCEFASESRMFLG